MSGIVRRMVWDRQQPPDVETLLAREWLVTNGLGGSSSGTVAGVVTRRYHGLLVAALPAPFGRTVMLSHLSEQLVLTDGRALVFGDDEDSGAEHPTLPGLTYLSEFRLELGLPVWRYEVEGFQVEKRITVPHLQNTVHVTYRLLGGPGPVRLQLRPWLHIRLHEAPLDQPISTPYLVTAHADRYEIAGPPEISPLRLTLSGAPGQLILDGGLTREAFYRVEAARGYDSHGPVHSPGAFAIDLTPPEGAMNRARTDDGSDGPIGAQFIASSGGTVNSVSLIASTESWETLLALSPEDVAAAEHERRTALLQAAPPTARTGPAAELVLAADQFIISPTGRAEDVVRAHAAGDEVRTVIAGYHWFTDWGRDTMISLEGLTLTTGRFAEAGSILRLFARHVRDGLIPNMFPEGKNEGLYHTADATLWFFHALDRYLRATDDQATLQLLLPTLQDIVEHHIAGTHFGIGVDPADGLLRQGAEGYQLTWMDAKVGDWVVTPRRGKAVEINALWYNALRLLAGWLDLAGEPSAGRALTDRAVQVRESFNHRFWYADGGYLYDVVDGEHGDDAACRPNQLFSVSLPHPVLAEERWRPVLQVVQDRLLTPVGLRSLAPGHPDYKPRYFGDLRARDAAYHQGTVWGWLAGPFVDAWLRVYPDDPAGASRALSGFEQHLGEGCLGTVAEIFDAEAPYTPRGCVAQAWSVAEVLRALTKVAALAVRKPSPAGRVAGRPTGAPAGVG
ncbi:MAG: amylo-alpha-1,6-glucosidase [Chloroflexota bacterium]